MLLSCCGRVGRVGRVGRMVVVLLCSLALCSFSRNFSRDLGGVGKRKIWGEIWGAIAKFGYFVVI